jgi:lipoprotein-releasing system ATP-binding protein
MMAPALRATALSRTYPSRGTGHAPLTLFRDLALEVAAGELVAVVGRSGVGKSTLLHLLAGLDRPTAGSVFIDGTDISAMTPDAAAALRNRAIGYVWQTHYLLPEFTAIENVAMPLSARGVSQTEARRAAAQSLEAVGLGARLEHRSGELSGGEQQRVSIARALVTGPRVLLADEPTGDLDDDTAAQIFALLVDACRTRSIATVIVTHNLELAGRADRILRLRDGRLV